MRTSTIPELRRIGRGWDWIATQIQDERNEAVRLLNAERNENEKLRAELRAVQGTDRGELLKERNYYREKIAEFADLTKYVSEKGLGTIGADVVPVVIGELENLERLSRHVIPELMAERDHHKHKATRLMETLNDLRQRQGNCTRPTLIDILQCVPSNALKEDIGWLQIAAGECPVDDAPTVLRVVAGFICKETDKARPHVFAHFGDQPSRRCVRCDQREALASDQCPG